MPGNFVDLSLNFVTSQTHQGGGCPPALPPPKYGPELIDETVPCAATRKYGPKSGNTTISFLWTS